MQIVKVTYTAKSGYVLKNQENINKVMNDLRNINHPGIRYCTYLGGDNKSFTHLALFEQEEFQQVLFNLESFKTFQSELKSNGLDSAISQEKLKLVGSSYDVF